MENSNKDCKLQLTRVLDAPIELVWEVWTKPEHIVNWWGPDGFTNTIHLMDFQEGGEWNLTMHGPDGTDYPNRSFFKEIIPFKKIVMEHFNPHFFATVLFEANGDSTQLNWEMLFDAAEMRDTVVKVHGAEEGQKQNVVKLNAYLTKLKAN